MLQDNLYPTPLILVKSFLRDVIFFLSDVAAWDEIEKKYGDADTMLEKELGINEAKKERLRNILLTTD